ncbi:MAG: beta-L-arabinofuranosidase domain-containing protein [Saprospiraceae bacterium]
MVNIPPNGVKPLVEDKLSIIAPIKIGGYIGRRLDSSYYNRILAQDPDRLIAPFNNRTETSCWQSEFWGKWFTSAVLAYRYRPEAQLKKVLDKAVDGLLHSQTPDGYIGNYADDSHLQSWDIWGRKYCMLGLLAYYDLTLDKKSLLAAAKLADHLMLELKQKNLSIVKMGNHRGMAASSILEPICLLYSRTGETRYLDFAKEMVRQWETEDGPQLISKAGVDVALRFPKPEKNWYGWEQGQKAYEMMSCYEGLLELYRLTGEEKYKQAVEEVWENILQKEINIAGSGSSVECWFHGKEHQAGPVYHYQETCVTTTWIKLSQQLLRLTGDSKYADAIETAYYNSLLGAMRPSGSDWAKYTPLSGQRLEGSEQCNMGLNCCNASGPRALFTFPLTAVMKDKTGFQINFFAESSFNLKTPEGNNLKLIQETNYPENGEINIKLEMERPEDFSIKIRIPVWSNKHTITIDGQSRENIKSGSNFEIKRRWYDGDRIKINFEMEGKVMSMGSNPDYLAITRGPIVLARDERIIGPSIESIIAPTTKTKGYIDIKKITPSNPEIWMEFETSYIPESYAEGGAKPAQINFCDYASAGNSLNTFPFFKVWLPQLFDPRK